MGKAALGKGMKDLISKNFGISEDDPAKSDDKAEEELRTSISRYQAQEIDISMLRDLKGTGAESIHQGIIEFRDAVKKLAAAKTVVKSLEPYGYTAELEEINKDVKNPRKADAVLRSVDELKERMQSEHNVRSTKKGTPQVKLHQELGIKAQRIMKEENGPEDDLDLDPDALDDLMNELEGLGDAFNLNEEELVEDPELLEKIRTWEAQGLFVDKLKNLLRDDIDKARAEAEEYEKDLGDLMVQKERFDNMDLSDFKKQAEELKIKFQYPNMSSEIKNELDLMEKYLRELEEEEKAKKLAEEVPVSQPEEPEIPPEEEKIEPEAPEAETQEEESATPEEGPEPAVEQETPVEKPVEEEAETPPEEISEPDEVPAPQPSAEEPAEAEPIEDDEFEEMSIDQMMDMAKGAYRDGDNERSLLIFEKILKKDPDNSKARFMKRRLSSKV